MQRNPSLLQKGPPLSVPLFLIHDGGGTTFAYHYLGSLNRTVYAIHNPRLYAGRPWPGGLPQMAKIYARLIAAVVPHGKILLGGWSLGGLISLEMAHVLQDSPIDVAGVVMLDTPCPRAMVLEETLAATTAAAAAAATASTVSGGRSSSSVYTPPFSSRCRPEIRLLILNMMRISSKMAEQWALPLAWSGPLDSKGSGSKMLWPCQSGPGCSSHEGNTVLSSSSSFSSSSSCSSSSSSISSLSKQDSVSMEASEAPSRHELTRPSTTTPATDEETDEPPAQAALSRSRLPHTVLLRCEGYVSLGEEAEPGAVAKVDLLRKRPLLGWEECSDGLIKAVLDIPGNHFNLFEESNVSRL